MDINLADSGYQFNDILIHSQFCPLRKLTKEKYKITIIRFPKCDTSVYDTADVCKTALMMFDANYTIYDNDDGLVEGEIYILDVSGFSFKQFLDVSKNVKTFIHYTKFLQECAPVHLICNHIANTSSVVDGIMTIIKPVLSKEVNDLVKFHKHGNDTMLEFVDKDVLPVDFGGTNGTIDEHYQDWLKVFETKRFVANDLSNFSDGSVLIHRDYLLNDDNWKTASDET